MTNLVRFVGALLLPAALLAASAVHADMELLEDADLVAVTGKEGVAVDLELRYNTDAVGAPLASMSSCAGNNNPCKFALNLNNRGTIGTDAEWVVMKDFYALLKINSLRLDTGVTPGAATAYIDPGLGTATVGRFENPTTCLLTGIAGGCAATAVQNLAALRLGFKPQAVDLTAASFSNIQWLQSLGRVSAEYDCTPAGAGATLCGTSTLGYNRDAATGTVLGLKLARGSALATPLPANIRVDGYMTFFGF